MTFGQRLKKLIEARWKNSTVFSEEVGVKDATTRSYFNRGSLPKADYLEALARADVGINWKWLLTGVGDQMFEENATTVEGKKPSAWSLPPMVTVDDKGEENIVLVDVKAQAGYPTKIMEPAYYRTLPTARFPHGKFRNATFRGFEVEGESMEPTFHHGTWVFGKFVDDWHKGNIREGYVYVVVTSERVLIKRILNRMDKGQLYLMSDNETWDAYPIPLEEVKEIWFVVSAMNFKFPNVRYDWRRKMSHMEADIHELKMAMRQLRRQLGPSHGSDEQEAAE